MNIASIDIGSNTVLLLIAKIENNLLIPILNDYHSPRISKNLLPGNNISNDKILHLLDILKKYKKKIGSYNCKNVFITATNAMRIAANSKEIVKLIKTELDFDVQIIDGKTEAKFSYLGASSSIPKINEKMVIDIGGGSTEIIYGINKEIKFKNSFQTGVVSLTEKYLTEFPRSDKSIIKAEKFLQNSFLPLLDTIPSQLTTLAVAGTPTTLSCINQNLRDYKDEAVERSELTLDEINNLLEKIRIVPSNKMIEKFGNSVKGREDILFAGVIILKSIMEIKLIDKIIVSSRGLRYGTIINYLL